MWHEFILIRIERKWSYFSLQMSRKVVYSNFSDWWFVSSVATHGFKTEAIIMQQGILQLGVKCGSWTHSDCGMKVLGCITLPLFLLTLSFSSPHTDSQPRWALSNMVAMVTVKFRFFFWACYTLELPFILSGRLWLTAGEEVDGQAPTELHPSSRQNGFAPRGFQIQVDCSFKGFLDKTCHQPGNHSF